MFHCAVLYSDVELKHLLSVYKFYSSPHLACESRVVFNIEIFLTIYILAREGFFYLLKSNTCVERPRHVLAG